MGKKKNLHGFPAMGSMRGRGEKMKGRWGQPCRCLELGKLEFVWGEGKKKGPWKEREAGKMERK